MRSISRGVSYSVRNAIRPADSMLPAVSEKASSAQAALALAHAAGFDAHLTRLAGLDQIDAPLARLAPAQGRR